jgi:hypothetical protein
MPQAYWFPAKRFGWGWGLPITWPGWAVLIAFVCLVAAGAWLFPPRPSLLAYIGYVAALPIILLIVVWMKGEPARWRWGGANE